MSEFVSSGALAHPNSTNKGTLRLSEVVSAMSYALDITEGQPEGHAVRTCMIGMRVAKEIYLSPKQRSALFYALLLKDLGCSSNASKLCYLFQADDRAAKNDLKTSNWTKTTAQIKYLFANVAPGAGLLTRFKKMMSLARHAGTL